MTILSLLLVAAVNGEGTCTLTGGEKESAGWVGYDTGDNWCHMCICQDGGNLDCVDYIWCKFWDPEGHMKFPQECTDQFVECAQDGGCNFAHVFDIEELYPIWCRGNKSCEELSKCMIANEPVDYPSSLPEVCKPEYAACSRSDNWCVYWMGKSPEDCDEPECTAVAECVESLEDTVQPTHSPSIQPTAGCGEIWDGLRLNVDGQYQIGADNGGLILDVEDHFACAELCMNHNDCESWTYDKEVGYDTDKTCVLYNSKEAKYPELKYLPRMISGIRGCTPPVETVRPTHSPSIQPTAPVETVQPTHSPSIQPTAPEPTIQPTVSPTGPTSSNADGCVPEIESSFEYRGYDLWSVHNVTSAEACNMICGAEEECLSWTWGKKRGILITDICFLMSSLKPNRQADDCCDSGVPCKGETEAEADCNNEEFGRTCLAQFSEGDACTVLLGAAFLEDLDEGELETKMRLAGVDMRCFECEELAHQMEEICMTRLGLTPAITEMPTETPTEMPTGQPTTSPTLESVAPTLTPTQAPSATERPTSAPTLPPTSPPTSGTPACAQSDLVEFVSAVWELGEKKLISTCSAGSDKLAKLRAVTRATLGMDSKLDVPSCNCAYALHEPENLALVDEFLPVCTVDSTPLPEMLTKNLQKCIATGDFTTAQPETEPSVEATLKLDRPLTSKELEATMRLVKKGSSASLTAELPTKKKELNQLSKVANDSRKILKKFRTRVKKAQKN